MKITRVSIALKWLYGDNCTETDHIYKCGTEDDPWKNITSFFFARVSSPWGQMLISVSNPRPVMLCGENVSSSCQILWLEFYLKDTCMFPVSSPYFFPFHSTNLLFYTLTFYCFSVIIHALLHLRFSPPPFMEKLYPDSSEVLFVVRWRNCMGNGYTWFLLMGKAASWETFSTLIFCSFVSWK